ncbi:hypothetical protein MIND_00831200 [Mycena indigotica]|uniref:Uncharacterized protein n=1 Tax=Mycena indigotica TaxID=2126181 RepID=A0A8H6SFV8_9AGAR|nr:uncharacterized protein MIND_00831200 [Mycena indigotica]KAF7298835.1 hypothetical protein MIND_00831200 [Mycena indigotica]
MGKSAKLHKRTQKKTAKTASNPGATVVNKPHAQAQTAKKKAVLKQGQKSKASTSHVLGGADYVDLMMGSRKRAREEAARLPQDTE